MEELKTLLITQARIGSSRFPRKVTQKIADTTVLGLHLQRVKKSKKVTDFLVATTFESGVGQIINIANKENVNVYQGNVNDVLDRFYQAALSYQPNYVVRVTSDCPLLDPQLIDDVIDLTIRNKADYGFNSFSEEFPDGQDVEVFKFEALVKAWKEAKLHSEREHVTPYIRNNSSLKGCNFFKSVHLSPPSNFNHIRMTVDEPKDLEAIKVLVEELGKDSTWQEYANYIIKNIGVFTNQDIQRNEGYLKSIANDKSDKDG